MPWCRFWRQGDVVIDAGNSYFKDTDARSNILAGKGN